MGIDWWTKNYICAVKTGWELPSTPGRRQEVVASLELAFHSLKEAIKNAMMNDDNIKSFFCYDGSYSVSPAQIIIYLRCNSITPPEYTW